MQHRGGFADRSGARDLVDVAQKTQMSHGHSRNPANVYFSASL
jgi:hypothetical protein